MKFKTLSLLSLSLLLSACSFTLNKDVKEPGESDTGIIEYFSGDELNTEGLSSIILETKDSASSSYEEGYIFEQTSEVLNSFVDTANIVSISESFKNVSQGNEGLQLGNVSTKLSGELTINLSTNVSMVEIYATPRCKEIPVEQGYEMSVDANVAVSLNNSKYIKLDSVNYETPTICKYKLADEGTKELSLSVYGQRAIIHKIVAYY
jgi:hypothetical protein